MLILLSGVYIGIIWLVFLKLKLLPWNKTSQIGAVAVGVVGLIAVLIGFGMGAPTASGGVTVQANVMSLSAHSFGRVTKVYAKINEPLKKGDPIFDIDRSLYEVAVRAAEANLDQATSTVAQLRAAWEESKAAIEGVQADQKVLESSIAAAQANVSSSDASVRVARAGIAASTADLARAKADVEIGQRQYDRLANLTESAVTSEAELDQAARQLAGFKAGLEVAEASIDKSQEELARAEATMAGAKATLEQTERSRSSLQAQLARAEAAERSARAAADVDADGEHYLVRSAKEQLAKAKYDLEQCAVVAPTDGYMVALGLTEGDYVRMMQVGTFVSTESYWAVAVFAQNTVRFIKPGMDAELALAQYPGTILTGKVDSVTYAAGEAQLPASGQIPAVNTIQVPRGYAVRIRLDEPPEGQPIRFASSGAVAVYTDAARPVHVIRKIMLRVTALLYWLP